MLVSDIINEAFRVAQVIRQGESPTDTEYADALSALTVMMHSWAGRRLITRANTEEPFTLVSGTYQYNIGVGQTWNTSKPLRLLPSYLRDSDSYDSPVEVWPMQEYNNLSDKAVVTGTPSVMAYDPGAAQQASHKGIVYLYPIPDAAYSFKLNSQKPFTEYTAITDTLTFDPPYQEAVKYELGKRLWREYHKGDVPIDLLRNARDAMQVLEAINSHRVVADLSRIGGGKGAYNINTGVFE